MKKTLAVLGIIGLVGAGALIGSRASATDTETIKETVESMDKEDLESKVEDKTPNGPVDLTDKLVRDIILDLQEIQKNNGYGGIAVKRGVSRGQVMAVEKERQAQLRAIQAADELLEIVEPK